MLFVLDCSRKLLDKPLSVNLDLQYNSCTCKPCLLFGLRCLGQAIISPRYSTFRIKGSGGIEHLAFPHYGSRGPEGSGDPFCLLSLQSKRPRAFIPPISSFLSWSQGARGDQPPRAVPVGGPGCLVMSLLTPTHPAGQAPKPRPQGVGLRVIATHGQARRGAWLSSYNPHHTWPGPARQKN